MKPTNVEFLVASGCKRCSAVRESLRSTVQHFAEDYVHWTEVDIARHPNRAVDLGVVSTPAIALDGELVFPLPPGPEELRDAIELRISQGG